MNIEIKKQLAVLELGDLSAVIENQEKDTRENQNLYMNSQNRDAETVQRFLWGSMMWRTGMTATVAISFVTIL